MNKLNNAWQALKKLPPEQQERAADALLDFAAQASSDLQLSDDQAAEVERRLGDKSASGMTLDEFRARVGKLGS
jgi:putative addiction module component (TIGR02574 family)